MRHVKRGDPPAELATALRGLHAGVTTETDATTEWSRFARSATFQSLSEELRERFRNKCAYCEAARSLTVEHFWPKSPHANNGHRGTPLRLYLWDNMLAACRDCQSFECKVSHMAWDGSGRPLLLDPCAPEDDPIRFLEIVLAGEGSSALLEPRLPEGWIDPRPDLDGLAADRAAESIKRLKLNVGRRGADLWEERARKIQSFWLLVETYRAFGPDYRGPGGRAIRELLAEAIGDRAPFLAGIRQLLYANGDSGALRAELIGSMPELEPLVQALGPAGESSGGARATGR
jgi:hypothetical protein